jgi:subtilase family serine protease
LAFIVLAGAACSSSATSLPQPQEGIATAAAAQAAPGGSPTLDLGSTDPTQVVTVSIIFKAQPMNQLEAYVQSTEDPSSPSYHRFLSVHDFASRFAPSSKDIARVSAYLGTFGIQVGATLADNLVLKATGTVGAFTQAFTFQVHDFQNGSSHYHRPVSAPHIPSTLSDVMLVVTGFSTQPAFVPKVTSARAAVPSFASKAVLPSNRTATGVPGNYTVGDFANQYDVNPLYQAGIDGKGSTIGIATLASFYPADAYEYWSTIGLTVDQDRITQIHVDGGAQLSAAAGSIETALDVEQSGGLAPGAKMVVYDAPNTDGGFLDLFYNAASDNLVDSLSVSWGEAEIFYMNSALTGGDFTAELTAFHQAFLEGAAQGISMFAAAGDDGAYDSSGLIPGLSNPLTVDVPGSDPAITAAGGTTTPVTINGNIFGGPTTANNYVVSKEQVWGWDGFQSFLDANDVAPEGTSWSFFSTGGGGGVSSFWPAPYYQQGYPGQRLTQPGQAVTYTDSTGATQTLLTLPAHFAGRNTPDISADADPFSGYLIYSTPDGGWNDYYGGTSFVAPQMNGVSALVRQRAGGRVGLWNPMLYRFAQENRRGNVTVVDITAGDNWYYDGVPGYEPAAGLGVLDVQKFADAVATSSGAGCDIAN